MPELKPCPACGSRECESVVCTISADEHQSLHYNVECGSCYASGPVLDIEADAIAAWNSLPRRPDYNDVDCAGCPERRRWYLTWTTEPPKVAGWYWYRHKPSRTIAMINIDVDPTEYESLPGQWAGPIPEPREPK